MNFITKIPPPLLAPAIKALSVARVLHFLSQLRGLELYSRLFSSHPLGKIPIAKETERALLDEIWRLISLDAERAAQGAFPVELIVPEDPVSYFKQAPFTLFDAMRVHQRRVKNKWRDFSEDIKTRNPSVPDYFFRNFHFQSDGYLSQESAKAYDHQVEILFTGLSGAMRRAGLPLLIEKIGQKNQRVLKILDIGCGTGTFTRLMAFSFPEAEIVAIDLSPPYLRYAKNRLRPTKIPEHSRIQFQQMDGRSLSFENESFDLVVSSYLFHEMPEKDRGKVFCEALRVLRPEGLFQVVDSLQVHDRAEFNVFLEQFPKDYHEPFYQNYTQTPLEDIGAKTGFNLLHQECALFSKSCLFHK